MILIIHKILLVASLFNDLFIDSNGIKKSKFFIVTEMQVLQGKYIFRKYVFAAVANESIVKAFNINNDVVSQM